MFYKIESLPLLLILLLSACSLLSKSDVKLPYSTEFHDIKGWSLDAGAKFDAAVSATPGSGSIRLSHAGESWVTSDRITSDFRLPVEAGKVYTLSFKSKTETFPPPALEVYGVLVGESGPIDNSDGTMCANSRKGVWEENFVTIRIPKNSAIKYFKIKILMLSKRGISAPVWIDDVKFTKGVALPPYTPKKSFEGAITRVDKEGNIEIKKGERFEPFFPIGIYTDENRADWHHYRKLGFNTNMWASDAASIEKSKKAGLFSMMQIVQYIVPVGEDWIPQNPKRKIAHLRRTLHAIRESGLWDNLLFYYVDNEFYHLKPEFTKIIDIVREEDRHSHPIYMLSGAYGLARIYNDYVDLTGTYVAKDGFPEPTVEAFEVLERTPGQKQPVVFAQINRGVGKNFRAIAYAAIAKGAKGIGFWRDGGSAGPIEKRPIAGVLPTFAKEIASLLPLIRTPLESGWHAVCDNDALIHGERRMQGRGYLILSNPTDEIQHGDFRPEGLGYVPKEVKNYLTHRKVAVVKNGVFRVQIKPHDAMVLELVR